MTVAAAVAAAFRGEQAHADHERPAVDFADRNGTFEPRHHIWIDGRQLRSGDWDDTDPSW